MQDALDTITFGLFDYAGMFPPAAKSFEEMVKISAGFAGNLRRPGLVAANMVIDETLLSRVESNILLSSGFYPQEPLAICLLGKPIVNKQSAISEERFQSLTKLQEFNRSTSISPRTQIVSYEFRLDPQMTSDLPGLTVALRNIKSFLVDDPILLCVEPDLSGDNWERVLFDVTETLSSLNEHSQGPTIALKVRGSGPTAINVSKLAEAIHGVCIHELDFKATAGLHHPILEPARYGNTLGFLNLAAGLHLTRILGSNFPKEALLECLECNDACEYKVGAEFGWREYTVSLEEIKKSQSAFHFTIGSCSIDEPDSDLARLFPA